MTKTEKTRTIRIKESSYHKMKSLGFFGETFDDVIQRILEIGKAKRKKAAETKNSKAIADKLG